MKKCKDQKREKHNWLFLNAKSGKKGRAKVIFICKNTDCETQVVLDVAPEDYM